MTNEEAIIYLTEAHNDLFQHIPYNDNYHNAIDLAIKALETGEVYMTGEDYNLYMEGYKAGKKDFEPKKGEWINHRNDYGHNIADCSECGKTMQWHDEDEDGIPRYCWYCGAKMQKGDIENG